MKKIFLFILLFITPIVVNALSICPNNANSCDIGSKNLSIDYNTRNYAERIKLKQTLNGQYVAISELLYSATINSQSRQLFCLDINALNPGYVDTVQKVDISKSNLYKGIAVIYRLWLKEGSNDNSNRIIANDAMRILVATSSNRLSGGYWDAGTTYLQNAANDLATSTKYSTFAPTPNHNTLASLKKLQKWYCAGAIAAGFANGKKDVCKSSTADLKKEDYDLLTLDNVTIGMIEDKSFTPVFTPTTGDKKTSVKVAFKLSGDGYENIKKVFAKYPNVKKNSYFKVTSCSATGYTCNVKNANTNLFDTKDGAQQIEITKTTGLPINTSIRVTVNYTYQIGYDMENLAVLTCSNKRGDCITSQYYNHNQPTQRFLMLDVEKPHDGSSSLSITIPGSSTTTKTPTTTPRPTTTTSPLYRACKKMDGKYYNKEGYETNLDTFMKECCDKFRLTSTSTQEEIDAWDKYCYKPESTTTLPRGCEYEENNGHPIYKFNSKQVTELEYLNHGCCDLDLKYLTEQAAKDKFKKNCQSSDIIHMEYECGTKAKIGSRVDTGTGVEVTECINEYEDYTKDSYIWQEPIANVINRVNVLEHSDAYKDDISEIYSSSGLINNIDRSYLTKENKASTGETIAPVSAGNNYCMLYTSESNDMHFPGTAVATSGRFFVFNELKREECVNSPDPSNNCFRQPSIDGKIYTVMHTNFEKWQSDYISATAEEARLYGKWQASYSNKDKQLYNAAKARRMALETYKTECESHNEIAKYWTYNLQPEITFKFTQKAYDGDKAIDVTDTIDMSISYEAVKYWPNATQKPKLVAGSSSGTPNKKTYTIRYGNVNETKEFDTTENYYAAFEQTVYYRPSQVTYATIGSGLIQLANDEWQTGPVYMYENGLMVGYVYNVRLTTYKGAYTTAFTFDKLGHQGSNSQSNIQRRLDEYKKENNFTELSSECVYCNQEGEFKRECDVCPEPDPNNPTPMKAAYIYRAIALSDVTPHDRENTNWSDAKGKAAEERIQSLSGSNVIASLNNEKNNAKATILSETSSDPKAKVLANDTIYNDSTREYLEYEFNLTTKDMQIIRANNNRSDFDYGALNLCANTNNTVGNPTKSQDANYCFICNQDGKECVSTFIDAFADTTTTANTRDTKWKYFFYDTDSETGTWYQGKMSSISKFENGRYPDPLNQDAYLKIYKNWP